MSISNSAESCASDVGPRKVSKWTIEFAFCFGILYTPARRVKSSGVHSVLASFISGERQFKMNRRIGLFTLLILVLALVLSSQTAAMPQTPESKVKFHYTSPCLTIRTGSPSVAILKNNCNKGLQFTIHWSGSNPPQDKLYRVGPTDSREVAILDLSGLVTAENEPSFGKGPPGQISILQKHTPVPDTDVLTINNHHPTYGLVKLVLRLYWKSPMTTNGKSYLDNTHLLVIRPLDLGDVTVMSFRTDLYDRYEVKQLQAEDDPQ